MTNLEKVKQYDRLLEENSALKQMLELTRQTNQTNQTKE